MSREAPLIVLLHGHTASGKSTLGRKLGKRLLRSHALHSALIRRELGIEPPEKGGYNFDLRDPVFVDTVSRQVYERLVSLGSDWLERGESVIFDAAFNFYRQRLAVYELALKHDLAVHAIRCVCPNDAEVRRRLDWRAQNPADAFSEASAYATYLSTKTFAEDLELDWHQPLGPTSILEYDSLEGTLTVIARRGNLPHALLGLGSDTSEPAVGVRGSV